MMKTVIQVKDKSRCKKRESLIREALDMGMKPKQVSDEQAIQLTSNGHVYAPKSLLKGLTEHFINTELSGSKLKRV
jgi:hypothetical protein|tara:strand:- start:323 stop:550 length:228 start_codon:yes stop_codon:yes gene_type:complete